MMRGLNLSTRLCQLLSLFGLDNMAIYLLDSNACIDVLRDPFGRVAKTLSYHIGMGDKIVTSRIVQYELELGARNSNRADEGLANVKRILSDGVSVLDFDGPATQATAKLSSELQGRGNNLQAYDALIVGHASALGATFVTSDARLAASIMGEVEVVSWR
jgi:tRNA(fMet)-specific endonuclease VapC